MKQVRSANLISKDTMEKDFLEVCIYKNKSIVKNDIIWGSLDEA